MELIKKYIHMNREKGKAVTQITLDDDFNLPDTKPDLIRIILEKGEISLDEATITQDHVWLKGVLRFSLLYRSDQEEGKISSMNGPVYNCIFIRLPAVTMPWMKCIRNQKRFLYYNIIRKPLV